MNRDWREVRLDRQWRATQQALGAVGIKGYRCTVDDGDLRVIIALEPVGWHLSISHADRYPTWDEIADARYDLLDDGITMAMLLPPRDQYVNLHDTTFHLHEIDNAEDPIGPVQPRTRASGLVVP